MSPPALQNPVLLMSLIISFEGAEDLDDVCDHQEFVADDDDGCDSCVAQSMVHSRAGCSSE